PLGPDGSPSGCAAPDSTRPKQLEAHRARPMRVQAGEAANPGDVPAPACRAPLRAGPTCRAATWAARQRRASPPQTLALAPPWGASRPGVAGSDSALSPIVSALRQTNTKWDLQPIISSGNFLGHKPGNSPPGHVLRGRRQASALEPARHRERGNYG